MRREDLELRRWWKENCDNLTREYRVSKTRTGELKELHLVKLGRTLRDRE